MVENVFAIRDSSINARRCIAAETQERVVIVV